MRILVVETREAAAVVVVDRIADVLRVHPAAALGLATGGTMQTIYDELVRRDQLDLLDLQDVCCFLLDEYVGLDAGDSASYLETVRRALVNRTRLPATSVFGPDGSAVVLDVEARRYDQQVTQSRISLQLLGIGQNGHLAFNEPGSSFQSRTRQVDLADETRRANSRFFTGKRSVPSSAITQGIATILQAEQLVLVAFGADKSDAVKAALEGPVSSSVPASALQLHSHVTVVLDEDAARELQNR